MSCPPPISCVWHDTFYHYLCENHRWTKLVTDFTIWLFLCQLNCIAIALYFLLLATSPPEQAYFPKIPHQILIGRHFRCESKPNNKITEKRFHHHYWQSILVATVLWVFLSLRSRVGSPSALFMAVPAHAVSVVPRSNAALLVYCILWIHRQASV